MKVQPIADRLAGLGFKYIGGALEYAALTRMPGNLPQAYIVEEAEQSGDNRLATVAIDQRVSVEFSVVIIFDGAGRQERQISEALERLRGAVRDELLGWKHPEAAGPILFAGGRLLSVDGSTVSWAVRFRTAYRLRKVG